MSYVVLARKWRPMEFEQVVGQDHVTTTLKNAITNDRLASAYLFTGPRGVGKTTTARIFAKAINCETGPTPTPCNDCSSCNEITGSRSLDVFEIDGASNRGIDEVRNLRGNLKYAATKGKYKIYIIDEVHMLTTEAFNALLKTLEEPPPKVLFIFATTEPHKVPATILSRCQRYDFHRIPVNEIVQQLQKICKKEKIEIDEKSLYLLAKKSDGSLRDSQSLLDQVVAFCGEKISVEGLSELLGIIDQEFFFEATDCITKKDIHAVLKLVENIFNRGYDMAEFLNGLTEHFRNILVITATRNTDHLEGLETYAERYQETGKSFSETDILRLIQMMSENVTNIKQSSNPKLILEMLMIKMAKMDKSVELEALLSTLSNLKEKTGPQPKEQSQMEEPPAQKLEPEAVKIKQIKTSVSDDVVEYKSKNPETNGGANGETNGDAAHSLEVKIVDPVVSLEKIKTEWPEIIEAVKGNKIHLGSFLNEGYPTALNESTLTVSFGKENGFHINMINQNKRVIQEVILERTGFRLNLHCKKDERSEFKQIIMQTKPQPEPPEKASVQDVLEIPIVKKVIEVFDGEIVNATE